MITSYFIDSENVGDDWISLLDTVEAFDEILVFYTAKSPHINYKNAVILKESPKKVNFIECYEGSNALDFQLCTELGMRAKSIGYSKFVIVSNDTGFDAAVKYCRDRNINVIRIKGSTCISKKNTDEEASAIAKSGDEAKKAEAVVDTICGTSDEIAKELLYIVGKNNLNELHTALKLIFGENTGKSYYKSFKSNSYSNYLSQHKKLDANLKRKEYCSLVFNQSEKNISMPSDFPAFIISAWNKKNNLNSLRASLLNEYGKENGVVYYDLMKKHVKILAKIK